MKGQGNTNSVNQGEEHFTAPPPSPHPLPHQGIAVTACLPVMLDPSLTQGFPAVHRWRDYTNSHQNSHTAFVPTGMWDHHNQSKSWQKSRWGGPREIMSTQLEALTTILAHEMAPSLLFCVLVSSFWPHPDANSW